jgi:phage/plasmid-associated DNA primase
VESKEWAECMMNYLVTLFIAGQGFRNLAVPEKIILSTSEYKNETDVIGRFITEHITALAAGEVVTEGVTTGRIYDVFQKWKRTNEIMRGSTVELKKRLEATYGSHPRAGWTSFNFSESA